MCDMLKRKSQGYCRGKNKLRTVTTTKWELPIPGSKSYWDKICNDLEQRKEHVSDATHLSSLSPNATTDPNTLLNSQQIKLNKFHSGDEPIVKISPPTPMRTAPVSHAVRLRINDNYSNHKDNGNSVINSVSPDITYSVKLAGSKDVDLYDLSVTMTESLKANNVKTKKSCQIHKNAIPLKIFDDNLKQFLPKKELPTKLLRPTPPVLSTNFLHFSKLHREKYCPFRQQSKPENRTDLGVNSAVNKNRRSKRSRTVDLPKIDADQFLKVPTSPYAHLRPSSSYRILNDKSKSKILESNLTYMLRIPKLEDAIIDCIDKVDETNNSETDVQLGIDYQQKNQQIATPETGIVSIDNGNSAKKVHLIGSSMSVDVDASKLTKGSEPIRQTSKLPRLCEELSMALDSDNAESKLCPVKNRIDIGSVKDKPEKDFLKVPKLGAISSYPSFSKLTAGESVDGDEGKKKETEGLPGDDNFQFLNISDQQVELGKRDYLKVPKLSMMSSYPSFTSLIPESLDSDDNASELTSDRAVPGDISNLENSKSSHDAVITGDKLAESSIINEKTVTYNENSESMANQTKADNSSANSSTNKRAKRKKSLKDSIRYAYKALKFLTTNKTLDFEPRSYYPQDQTGSSSGSSRSSRTSKYSKFEPAIKLLTYEDIDKDRPPERSISSSSYGTVRSRLKQNASQYLGSEYVYTSSKARPATASTTMPSLTRSTSGSSLNFQEPVLQKNSNAILNELPKISIFPRKKRDKCLACLYNSFEEPVQSRRKLPLAVWNAVKREKNIELSESISSSISLPDVKDFAESQSGDEDNWTEILRTTRRSPLLGKTEWKSSKSSPRTNLDSHKFREPFTSASEETQPSRGDVSPDTTRRNLQSKDSLAANNYPKPLSSSEHSKPSSLSGHSSESEEPHVQVKQTTPASECFVSPYAPLHWAPSLDPLKSLKFRKPVSMYGRAASITKTEDDVSSDDDATDFRSTRKETKSNNAAVSTKTDATENAKAELSNQIGEKGVSLRQHSVVAKTITSQLSPHAGLGKIKSRVDLLGGGRKIEDETKREEVPEELSVDSQEAKTSDASGDMKLKTVSESGDDSIPVVEDGEGKSQTQSTLPLDASNEIRSSVPEKVQEDIRHSKQLEELTATVDEILSNDRAMKILEDCIEKNLTPLEILKVLSSEAVENLTCVKNKNSSTPNSEITRSIKIAKNLIKLLIDSRRYLNPDTFSPNLEFSSPQTPLCNPRQLRRVLPPKTYNLIARILGMPENPAGESFDRKTGSKPGYQLKDPFKHRQSYNQDLDNESMIVHPPSARGEKIITDEEDFDYPQLSPYALFMRKPRRKAITWRPLTERDMLGYDPEATLNMRATRVTNKICKDFCEWLRGLGGGHGDDIDEEVLRDMFQIEFTAEACRTMQVLIKEIPMVPMAVALARNTPGAGELALTRKHLIKDAKAERMPKKTIGFGSSLPESHRFVPPKNRVNEKWLQCENVPGDLETMATVWKGITHLDSVKGFLAWVKAHPGVKPPKILTDAYAKKEELSRQPSTDDAGGHIELEMDQIESLKVGDLE